jgi:glutathione S-transferase
MALHQKKIPFQARFINILHRRQYTEDFLALNPRGEVPVLVDSVKQIPDSNKIIDYLEDNFSNGNERFRDSFLFLALAHYCNSQWI